MNARRCTPFPLAFHRRRYSYAPTITTGHRPTVGDRISGSGALLSYSFLTVRIDIPPLTNYSWISYELHVGTSLGQRHTLVRNLRPVLDFSAQTTRGNVLDFFVKPKNGLV